MLSSINSGSLTPPNSDMPYPSTQSDRIPQGKMLARLLLLALASVLLLAASPARAEGPHCVAASNAGGEHRRARRLLTARDEYLRCVATENCPDIVKAECLTGLEQLRLAIPTLIVAVVDGRQQDVSGAALVVDGRPVPLDGSPIELDPGSHHLTASKGDESSELDVIALESDRNRKVVLVLRNAEAEQPRVEPAQMDSPLTRTTPVPRSALETSSAGRVPAYLLGSAAAIGLGGFAYFGLKGKAGLSDLSSCKPRCNEDEVSTVRRNLLLADVSLGVSVVTLAAAVYSFISTSSRSEPASAAALSIRAGASQYGAQLGVRWVQ